MSCYSTADPGNPSSQHNQARGWQAASHRCRIWRWTYHQHAKDKNTQSNCQTIKVTGTGKLRRRKQGSSHLRRIKSQRVLRSLDKDEPVAQVDEKRVRRILGLGKRSRS